MSNIAMAGPVFVQPLGSSGNTSTAPLIVSASASQTPTLSKSTRDYIQNAPRYEYRERNPFAGTNYGKITTEQSFYDSQSKKWYGQYEYMGVLAQRGDKTSLNALAKDLQQNGVFDQNKFKTAVTSALSGNAQTQPVAEDESQQSASGNSPQVIRRQQATDDDITPQRLHSPYDEDMADDPATKKVNPIFLR